MVTSLPRPQSFSLRTRGRWGAGWLLVSVSSMAVIRAGILLVKSGIDIKGMTWPLGLSSSKKALMSKPFWNEGRKKRVMDKRTTDVPSNSNLGCQHTKAPGAAGISPFMNLLLPTQPKMWMTCEGWPHHRGLRPLLFSNSGVGSFTSHKNQISASAVTRDLQFFPGGGTPPRGPTPHLLHTIFCEKGNAFVYLLLTNGTPFHIPRLELCNSFNCCKCSLLNRNQSQKVQRFLDFIKP